MIEIRKAATRGHFDHGWLDTWHTFSFADYYDPRFMGFGDLRVINEDRVAPGRGFGSHPHHDMEIVTYVLEGRLRHEDSMGNGSVIVPGRVQRMTAGTGVTHSERNDSREEPVHLLQIWIFPEESGLEPSYEERDVRLGAGLHLVGSRDGRKGSLTIHQDVSLWAAALQPAENAGHTLAEGRKGWLQLARGQIILNGQAMDAGDGAALVGERDMELVAGSDGAELLLFDLR